MFISYTLPVLKYLPMRRMIRNGGWHVLAFPSVRVAENCGGLTNGGSGENGNGYGVWKAVVAV